jgi:hypothetical protein
MQLLIQVVFDLCQKRLDCSGAAVVRDMNESFRRFNGEIKGCDILADAWEQSIVS